MSLPKIDQPTFELKIPSTKKTIKFRPFLVKEEKILLMGLEGGDNKSIVSALKQIINNCSLDTIDVDKLSSFDLEYFFLKLRSKSISEVLELKTVCQKEGCEFPIEFSVDLSKIEVSENPEHTTKIELTPTIGLMMRYPTLDMLEDLPNKSENAAIYDLIINSIDQIYDASQVYYSKDIPKKELETWIEALGQTEFVKIKNFFETMPKISYSTEVTCGKCSNIQPVTIEGLQNFFQ